MLAEHAKGTGDPRPVAEVGDVLAAQGPRGGPRRARRCGGTSWRVLQETRMTSAPSLGRAPARG